MTRVGLVLGAGGVTGGAFHAGVLSALAEVMGWDARTAEIVVGTSAGSVTGAVLRAGLPPTDLAAPRGGTVAVGRGPSRLVTPGGSPHGLPLAPPAAGHRCRRASLGRPASSGPDGPAAVGRPARSGGCGPAPGRQGVDGHDHRRHRAAVRDAVAGRAAVDLRRSPVRRPARRLRQGRRRSHATDGRIGRRRVLRHPGLLRARDPRWRAPRRRRRALAHQPRPPRRPRPRSRRREQPDVPRRPRPPSRHRRLGHPSVLSRRSSTARRPGCDAVGHPWSPSSRRWPTPRSWA